MLGFFRKLLLFLPLLIVVAVFCFLNFTRDFTPPFSDVLLSEKQNIGALYYRSKRLPEINLSSADIKEAPQPGSVTLLELKRTISPKVLRQHMDGYKGKDGFLVWSSSRSAEYTASAPGIDDIQHIVNGYLQGYMPYKAENVFIPLYVLSKKKRYQYDHITHKGKEERWQTSKQAFHYPRGDCEDHAIALADWLIESGHDARVVLGDFDGEGHAWVVLFKDNKEYLLEATDKSYGRRKNRYPLAKFEPKYHPQWMFNQTDFWTNTGSKFTTSYSSKKWVKKSRYNRI
jgi:hypothetical protein